MTENGIKDTYQLHVVERLYNSYKGKQTNLTKQATLDAEIARLLVNVMTLGLSTGITYLWVPPVRNR
ncbi:hypothetical protein M422DRAFT_183276 [Sphaerobolus stellatus SS14]|uniref:Uncharacterized protein n=1 Tax=Sphaerobolus stellatus (strain SS14) TaxID=990650 RepID=A0A0C9TT89_SPHS4|nr:hypothetical protein M422DRAFT_183276 [Sphaerobolus stellatus SS14]